jgi:hypothetical protein
MTTDNLYSLSLEELDEVVAVEIAGWSTSFEGQTLPPVNGVQYFIPPGASQWTSATPKLPPFSRSADAILPWLEKEGSFNIDRTALADDDEVYRVSLRKKPAGDALGSTFPHAACLALIRAERAKKQSNA